MYSASMSGLSNGEEPGGQGQVSSMGFTTQKRGDAKASSRDPSPSLQGFIGPPSHPPLQTRVSSKLARAFGRINVQEECEDHGLRNAKIALVASAIFGTVQTAQLFYLDNTSEYLAKLILVDALVAFALVPLVVSLYLALPDLCSRLLQRLRTDGIIAVDTKHLCDVAHEFQLMPSRSSLSTRRWSRPQLVIPIAIPVCVYFFYTVLTGPGRDDILGKVLLVVTVAAQTVLVYLGLVAIIRLGMAARAIGRILRTLPVTIQPLHPDGCGGLWIVGRMFSLTLNAAAGLGIIAVGLVLLWDETTVSIVRRPEPYLLAGLYVGLLPLAFLNLLWRPHQLMANRRTELLRPLAKALLRAFSNPESYSIDDVRQVNARTECLSEIVRQHSILDALCPVWPLHVRRLRAVALTAVLPLILAVVTSLLSTWTQW
jgi:hypothetical protein